MMQGDRAGRAGRWVSLAVPLVAWLAGCSATGPRNMPPMPSEVRAAVAEVEAAFASAKTDPPTFVQLAKAALPRLREALQQWTDATGGSEHRSAIRAWMLQAGQVETAIAQLPDPPSPADLRSVREAWAGFRESLP